ncbi:MAG: hypothetical protein LBF83_07440 [Spirochaetaceae bacterium]|nr:hypothetical protein [Spirochaetaceae bacterium]
MGFTPTRLQFNIEKAAPVSLTPANLRVQLNSIGFTCEHTFEPALEKYIGEGLAKVKAGSSFLVAILSPKESVVRRAAALSGVAGSAIKSVNDIAFADNTIKVKTYDGRVEEYYLERVNGSYRFPNAANIPHILAEGDVSEWDPTLLKFEMLSVIMAAANFDKLRQDDFNDFNLRSAHEKPTESINATDVNTIKEVLAKLVVLTTSLVLNGLTIDDVQSTLVSRFAFKDTSGRNFSIVDRMITLWANNPKPDGSVDALGAINCNWAINGENRPGSKKSAGTQLTNFNVETRSVVYTDENFLNNDYNHVKTP